MAKIEIFLLPQKSLLEWNFLFGHRDIRYTQLIIWSTAFGTDEFLSSSCINFGQRTKCKVCQYTEEKRKDLHGKKTQIDVSHERSICYNTLLPGSGVSVDNFESLLKGLTYTSFGSITFKQFSGRCIVVDHMIGYIHVERQLGFLFHELFELSKNMKNALVSWNYGLYLSWLWWRL